MFIKIRKENFGYVLFDRWNRTHHFVKTDEKVELLPPVKVIDFISEYYPQKDDSIRYSLVFPPPHNLLLSSPIGMYLEICGQCNLSCEHCYQPPEHKTNSMSYNEIVQLIDDMASIGVLEVRLCGKEPAIHPKFLDIAHHIKTRNMFLGINTNACHSEIKQDEIINLNPDYLVVSVDGTEETHDSIRTRGSYEKAVSFLQKLSKTDIKRRINTVVSSQTLGCIESVVALAYKTGCDVSFLPFRTLGRPTEYKVNNALDRNMMFSAVKSITEIRKKYPTLNLITYFDILDEKPSYHHSTSNFNKPCPARKNGFITHNGDFFPCDFLRHWEERFYCGNVRSESFWKIWSSSEVLQDFQKIRHPKCEDCGYYLTKCNGGCFCESLGLGKLDDELCFLELINDVPEKPNNA